MGAEPAVQALERPGWLQRPQKGSWAVLPSPKLNKIFILFKLQYPRKTSSLQVLPDVCADHARLFVSNPARPGFPRRRLRRLKPWDLTLTPIAAKSVSGAFRFGPPGLLALPRRGRFPAART